MMATNYQDQSRFLGPEDATVRLDQRPLAAASITTARHGHPSKERRDVPSRKSKKQRSVSSREWHQHQWRLLIQAKLVQERKKRARNLWILSIAMILVVPVLLHGIKQNAGDIRLGLEKRVESVQNKVKRIFP